jgi:hypothetical protein
MRMEKGDIYGLVGMILGLGAVSDLVTYFVIISLPMYTSLLPYLMPILMPMLYAIVIGGGIVGVILSIIGISKNGSKFGVIGLIASVPAIIIFILVLMNII